ncbi:SRPBCC family protein [Pseudotabrizicola sp. L79]|uniref:SRPBCC family protein n=1 Tax=Pseudotabrizicola sp. L79 TaxID=3118402 RepID=UPI002F935F68
MPQDPQTDLDLRVHLAAPPDKVWRALTEPALLEQWFAPKPVVTRDVVLELWPGGSFKTTMDVPGHGTVHGHGCVLEVVPNHRLVWTDLMQGGYRPNSGGLGFTALVTLSPDATGTVYHARAMHRTADQCAQHQAMGFHDGWGKAAQQLDELAGQL